MWLRLLCYRNFNCCVSADATVSWSVSSVISATRFDTKIFSIWIKSRISFNHIKSQITSVQVKSLSGQIKSWKLLNRHLNQTAIWNCPSLYTSNSASRAKKLKAELHAARTARNCAQLWYTIQHRTALISLLLSSRQLLEWRPHRPLDCLTGRQ